MTPFLELQVMKVIDFLKGAIKDVSFSNCELRWLFQSKAYSINKIFAAIKYNKPTAKN